MRPQFAILILCASFVPLSAYGQAPAAGNEAQARPRLTRAPELVRFVEAAYPPAQKEAGRTASVVLEIAISAAGTVDAARVIDSAGPDFDAAALSAVRQFTFRAAEVDNEPAPIKIAYRYEFVLKENAPTTGGFAGRVSKRGSGEPLAGVTVELDSGARATTDAEGKFVFEDLAPGAHRVTLVRDDLKAMQTEEQVEAGKKLEAIYEVELQPVGGAEPSEEADDMEIVVVAPTLTKQVVSTVVEAEQARRVAGTQGDVLKVVENMPGVARATAGSGQVVVWGASPQDTRVYVDGVRVPLLYHFGGLRSVIHSDTVRSVELIPGGYGAAYGRGLGGLVTVDTRAPSTDRWRGSLGADVLDASAYVSGPIADELSLSLAGRRSHVDYVFDKLSDEDVEEFFPLPDYSDAQARLRHAFSPSEYLELGGLHSSDATSRNVASADPADRKRESRNLNFQRLHVRYQYTGADGSQVSFVPWIGRDESRLESRFGGVPADLNLDSTLYGLRASWRGRAASFLTATVGLDVEAVSTTVRRVGSVSTPPREGDPRIFGQTPSSQINYDEWRVVSGSAAPFVEADFALLGDTLHVVPGLRLEPHVTGIDRRLPVEAGTAPTGAYTETIRVQPRISVRYALTPRVAFKAAYGVYGQPPLAEDLSSVFGNPLLDNASGKHYLAGASVNLTRALALETTIFHSKSTGLAVRNPITAPLIAQALTATGEGRSYGSQLLIRHDLRSGFFGWVAYTLLRSERLDRPGGDWRLFDYDQTHVLTALASYDLGAGFDIGARVRYATGYPRTPVRGAYYDAQRDTYQPRLGRRNEERIPDFVQLDVRASKRFSIGTTRLELYADVQNVTDRENAEEIVYSADYSEKRYIRGLPILPVIGAKWDF